MVTIPYFIGSIALMRGCVFTNIYIYIFIYVCLYIGIYKHTYIHIYSFDQTIKLMNLIHIREYIHFIYFLKDIFRALCHFIRIWTCCSLGLFLIAVTLHFPSPPTWEPPSPLSSIEPLVSWVSCPSIPSITSLSLVTYIFRERLQKGCLKIFLSHLHKCYFFWV